MKFAPSSIVPLDEHNRKLLANVFPSSWVNPQPAASYNLVVIGGGTAGLVTAAGAAGLGAKVALVERQALGGDCLNVGCVPSKCLLSSAKTLSAVRRAGEMGIRISGSVEVDFSAVMERMRKLRAGISDHDSADRFRRLGVDVFLGSAEFAGVDRVRVGEHILKFGRAVIATGGRASAPPVPGLKEAGYLTNETIFSLTELPPRMAVIGAGPIGCELAQALQRFGAQITLLELLPQILPREDRDAAMVVEQALVQDGVSLVLGAQIEKVEVVGAEKILTVSDPQGSRRISVDEILVGAGRTPNLEGLRLELVGVDYDRKGIKVNDYLQTSNSRIYAAGDVCSAYQFTHTADAAARIVIRNALFLGRSRFSALTIPWATFTDPEISHVGLYPEQAARRGLPIDTLVRPLREVDRAIADGDREGFVKVHVKRGADTILGATIVARHAGDLISEVTVAMAAGLGLGGIANVIHPYPTQAEAIKQTGDAYNRTRLTPFVKSLLSRWLAWTR